MQFARLVRNVFVVLTAAPLTAVPQSAGASKPTPLILEKNEGEPRPSATNQGR
jgi:hypothetical protein